jgi:prepilin-type N-terminal cleavage/methylation domain-containing protein
MKNKNAFTLLELLVVIAVLAGFMALLVPNFMQVRIKSRDMRRKSDLATIQKALELYKQNQTTPVYPATLTACASLSMNGINYIKAIPQDPLAQCPTVTSSYSYIPSVDMGSYTLSACLENPNDPEGVASCPGGFTCSSGKCYQLTEP